MQHLIKKQIIQLKLHPRLDAFHIQQVVSEKYWQEMLPMLEKIFDELCVEEVVMHIDQLEIDVGTISVKEVEQNKWTELLLSKLREAIQKKMIATSSKQAVRKETATLNNCRQWLFYMQNGYLPWNAVKIDENWKNNVLEAFATDYSSITALRELISTGSGAVRRIILQHQNEFLIKLIELLTAESQRILSLVLEEVTAVIGFLLISSYASKKELEQKLWQEILVQAALPIKRQTPLQLANKIYTRYLDDPDTIQIIIDKLLPKLTVVQLKQLKEDLIRTSGNSYSTSKENSQSLTVGRASPNRDLFDFQKNGKKGEVEDNSITDKGVKKKAAQEPLDQAGKPSIQSTDSSDPGEMINSEVKSGAGTQDSLVPGSSVEVGEPSAKNEIRETSIKDEKSIPVKQEPPKQIDSSTDSVTCKNSENISEEGLFVHHAGLVLLHAFLSFFFKRLQLVEEGKFISINEQQKALFLLHYLATGITEAEEYDLAVPKILCAWPLDMPVDKEVLIDENEKREADSLLEDAIRQWAILKNTSADGLREGFLRRNGKFYTKNGKLHLQVETNAIDVLLDHLPWNLSIIKLPWMQELLRVEWR